MNSLREVRSYKRVLSDKLSDAVSRRSFILLAGAAVVIGGLGPLTWKMFRGINFSLTEPERIQTLEIRGETIQFLDHNSKRALVREFQLMPIDFSHPAAVSAEGLPGAVYGFQALARANLMPDSVKTSDPERITIEKVPEDVLSLEDEYHYDLYLITVANPGTVESFSTEAVYTRATTSEEPWREYQIPDENGDPLLLDELITRREDPFTPLANEPASLATLYKCAAKGSIIEALCSLGSQIKSSGEAPTESLQSELNRKSDIDVVASGLASCVNRCILGISIIQKYFELRREPAPEMRIVPTSAVGRAGEFGHAELQIKSDDGLWLDFDVKATWETGIFQPVASVPNDGYDFFEDWRIWAAREIPGINTYDRESNICVASDYLHTTVELRRT
ncbi:MAG: hypothetical protein LBP91_03305 [Coriobacteriales bacterium]|jgi:hypothetical protein|nr:hypothetical protein [Coriobacteriales bacterium]